jgi:hypothetical protein
MAASTSIPCIKLPNPKPLKITLPFGAELKSVIDISKGPPSDCTLIQGLMLQLAPALAGMECLLKILNMLQVLTKAPPDPFKLAKAATDLAGCFLIFKNIPCMIVDILKLIIAYLKCIIEAVESILNFRVGIDFSGADGNPVLLASLNCAQDNADASTEQLREALALILPLLKLIEPIKDMGPPLPGPAGDALKAIPEALAAIGPILEGGASVGIADGQKVLATLSEVKSTLDEIEGALDALPC